MLKRHIICDIITKKSESDVIMNDIPLFVGTNSKCFESFSDTINKNSTVRDCRIPSLLTLKKGKHKGRIIAAADKASCGADWGFIEIALRISDDNGDSFSEIKTVFSPPVRKYPFDANEYGSAFAIDPVMVETEDGKVILLVDFYPESKGLHAPRFLEKGTGYKKIGDEYCLKLYSGKTKLDGFFARSGKEFTLHSDGFVYDEKGEKTRFYVPQKHSEKNAYATFGDMYYKVGDYACYENEVPPLCPTENSGDIYVGNIFLSKGKKYADLSDPMFVEKKEIRDENGEFICFETAPAPFTAPMISYIYMFVSEDGGETFSQPMDLTAYYKKVSDGIFDGVTPGVGITLQNEKKHGRILIPCYKLNKAFLLISDDNGLSWHRNAGEFCENIDECQVVEMPDGKVFCMGRPKGGGLIPFSVSEDFGETFISLSPTPPSVPQCQKSLINLPIDFTLPDGYVNDGRFVLMSTPTGHSGKDTTRTDGKIFLGRIDGTNISWLKEYSVKDKVKYKCFGEFADFYAYSCLSVIDNKTIGLLYEGYPSGFIAFAKFTLD